MANVLQHPVDFQLRPLSHAPSPLGFGFGLGTSSPSPMVATGWQSTTTLGHTNPAAFQLLASSMNLSSSLRSQKRRYDADDETEVGGTRDRSMDRSPTPERLKRAPPKRARLAPVPDSSLKDEMVSKENKAPSSIGEHQDVDVGMLLASLPTQSLLPLLNSLLNVQPSLKSIILPLIPRPTLETAIQALAQSAKKLRDAYPYSIAPSFSQSGPSTSFGFGKQTHTQNTSTFTSHNVNNSGMRDSYIISRLRPHITEFVAATLSYLPYFSSVPAPLSERSSTQVSHQRDKGHPLETFLFLSTVTNHVISQAPLTQSSLAPLLLPRLSEEWKAWVVKVDDTVNCEGGMFGRETVQGWERTLDEMADVKVIEGGNMMMRDVRDLWVSKVGWLVGR